jgi:hypothetical protein
VSFILSSRKLREEDKDNRTFRGYFTLLVMVMVELHNRVVVEGDSGNNLAVNMRHLYDNLCLILVSRLVSVPFLRGFLRCLLPELPLIPPTVLKLLRLLVFTGSRNAAVGFISASITGILNSQRQPLAGMGTSEREKLKSVRFEAMHLLMMLAVQHINENCSKAALDTLLWCTIAEDFEIRSKAISYMIR